MEKGKRLREGPRPVKSAYRHVDVAELAASVSLTACRGELFRRPEARLDRARERPRGPLRFLLRGFVPLWPIPRGFAKLSWADPTIRQHRPISPPRRAPAPGTSPPRA